MRISLITPVLNRRNTLKDTLDSVLSQSYPDIEYIIIDGGSTDGTLDLIKEYEPKFNGKLVWKSEPDEGLFDAMNKGIDIATGDIVGIINSDDFYHDNGIIAYIARELNNTNVDAVYGDVHFVSRKDKNEVVRYYSSNKFRVCKYKFGFMPAHTTFFTYKKFYDDWGSYKPDYKISGDFELLLRFMKVHKLKTKYIHRDFLTMRTGGISTSSLANIITNNKEIRRACRENNVCSNYFYILSRYFVKVFECKPLNW